MKLISVIIIISIGTILAGCAEVNTSSNTSSYFNVDRVIVAQSGKDSTIQLRITFNKDFTITSCNIAYVDDYGKQYKLDDKSYSIMQKLCIGEQYAGGNIQLAGFFNTYFGDKKGNIVVTLYDKKSDDSLNYNSHVVRYRNEKIMPQLNI